MLQAGFARVEITPPLGSFLAGYFYSRESEDVLDPLMATAIAFDDGEKRALLIDLDLIGVIQHYTDPIRKAVAERVGTEPEGVFIECTHTHLGPIITEEYVQLLMVKLADAAQLAVNDLAPVTEKRYTRGIVEGVSFIRRYYMKDGSIRTNPGRLNPDIVKPVNPPDTESSLLVIKREGKKEIAIINFQVHPDVIGGCKISADYPKFVRETYEKLIPGSLCMYINGAQGDSNHIDNSLPKEICGGYKWARFMGVKIAASVASKYELTQELGGDTIAYGQKDVTVTLNKGRPEQMEDARKLSKVLDEEGREAAKEYGKTLTQVQSYVEAKRILMLDPLPDEKVLQLTALAVGDWVVAGFPNEPFTELGKAVKARSEFALTMPCCCANGHEGYLPTLECYDQGGYEVLNARYLRGSAEKAMEALIELVNSLK